MSKCSLDPRRLVMWGIWAAGGCLVLGACGGLDVRKNPESALKNLAAIARNLEEMRTANDIKQSFLFKATDIFFPNGITENPDQLPRLDDRQLELVNVFLQTRVRGIYENSGPMARTHPAYSRAMTGTPVFKRVQFTTRGQPEAMVDAEGVVFLDVRVLQAVFRAIVLNWTYSQERRGSGRRTDEIAAIKSFNAFVNGVKEAPPTTDLSLLAHLLAPSAPATSSLRPAPKLESSPSFFSGMLDRQSDAMEAAMTERKMRSLARSAQERFESSIDFIFAHELAHRALGHLERRALADFKALSAPTRCEELRKQEMQADEFAAVAIVAGQFQGSSAHTITVSSGKINVDPTGHVPDIYGYLPLFARGMSIAGFDDQLGFPGCTYPSRVERMNAVHSFIEYSRGVLDKALEQEGVLRGQWLPARDDARLAQILQAGDTEFVSGEQYSISAFLMGMMMPMFAPTLEVDKDKLAKLQKTDRERLAPRFKSLVSPLLQQRFQGLV